MTKIINNELNLIVGCMFSGKTTELLRIAKRLSSIKLNVLLLNYHEDTRYSKTEMTTHDLSGLPCFFIDDLSEVNYSDYDIICINEGQFFQNLRTFCIRALDEGKTIYVCGLDGDFKQEPFGEILDLLPLCNNITRLHAFCTICADMTIAHFTKRLTNCTEQKSIGTSEYIPVCRKHLH